MKSYRNNSNSSITFLLTLQILLCICTSEDVFEQVEDTTVTEEVEFPTTTLLPPSSNKTNADGLEWKLVPKKANWISPHIIWKILGFPTIPNPAQSQVLLNQEIVSFLPVDLSHYNVGEEDGIIKGTLNCECGIPAQVRISGAGKVPARINDIPWTAALVFKISQQPFCGASLINDRYLLTAGHCVALGGKRTNASELEVWLNDESTLLSHDTVERRLVFDVEEIIVHPGYKVFYNDIAIIKLKNAVPLGDPTQLYLVNPVCIPKDNEESYEGRVGTVAGWGATMSGGPPSPILLKIDVPILANEQCVAESKYKHNVRENMMCAGDLAGGGDSCQGDSGGPLIVKENDRAKLVGIVSWGWGCAEPLRPGVYARVGIFIEWILENTRDAEWCQVQLYNKKTD